MGSVLLIVHFLTAAEQGYYYALWSLVALQSVFELGFSFVILQVAAHERAHLEFHRDGTITGSEAAHLRLASLLQRAVKWYTSAAVVMGIVLMVGGMRFFSLHQQAAGAEYLDSSAADHGAGLRHHVFDRAGALVS